MASGWRIHAACCVQSFRTECIVRGRPRNSARTCAPVRLAPNPTALRNRPAWGVQSLSKVRWQPGEERAGKSWTMRDAAPQRPGCGPGIYLHKGEEHTDGVGHGQRPHSLNLEARKAKGGQRIANQAAARAIEQLPGGIHDALQSRSDKDSANARAPGTWLARHASRRASSPTKPVRDAPMNTGPGKRPRHRMCHPVRPARAHHRP